MAAVLAYDQAHGNTIESNTKIGGVSVGGLDEQAAQARLAAGLNQVAQRPVTVSALGKQFQLAPARVGIRPDSQSMAREAVAKGQEDSPLARTAHNLFGTSQTLPVRYTYPPGAIDSFVGQVKQRADQPARDASVVPSGPGLAVIPQADGQVVDATAFRKQLQNTLDQGPAGRPIDATVQTAKPQVTADQLPAKYPFYVTIDRANFQLHYFKNLQPAKSYKIAVGQAGLQTPPGLYHIETKEVDPAWHVPSESWAGGLAGQVIPSSSPQDPLKARWMGLADGVGIHGTDEVGSLGTAGSHGCIRMAIPDVVELYNQLPPQTPVFIV